MKVLNLRILQKVMRRNSPLKSMVSTSPKHAHYNVVSLAYIVSGVGDGNLIYFKNKMVDNCT